VALNIHSAQLGKVEKYQRGKLGTVAVCLFVCLFDGVQQHFSYIVAGSFIGGGNRRTNRFGGVKVSVFASSESQVDRIEQTTNTIVIYCFSTKYVALRRKGKKEVN
jgi:hypothetical protein